MAEYCTVVTGAASGIGYSVAHRLLEAGEHLALFDLNADRLQERYYGCGSAKWLACDLMDQAGFASMTAFIKEHFAGVKGFVHAAGFDAMAPLGMIAPDTLRRLFAIHAEFPIQFLGWMAKKQNHAAYSSAVLISSLSAHEGAKGHVAYAAAKGAVEGMLKPAAAELLSKEIRLNAVILGVVATETSTQWLSKLSPEQREALGKDYPLGLGRPESVADVIAFLLSQQARWITGQTLVCDGGHSLA